MQPSPYPQAMVFAEPKQENRQSIIPLLSFITYSPTHNILEHAGQQQRQFFFESLMQLLHCQNVGEIERTKDILRKRVVPLAPSLHAGVSEAGGINEKIHAIALPSYSMELQRQELRAQEQKKAKAVVAPEAQSSSEAPSLRAIEFKNDEEKRHFLEVQEKLAYVIADYSRGNAEVSSEIVQEFRSELEAESYKADDLMATLLIIIEDRHYGAAAKIIGTPRPIPPLLRVPVPLKLKKAAQESAQTHLGSVREMLYYYFSRHPSEFAPILAAAIGLPEGKEGNEGLLLEALATALAKEGGFSLANRILSALKRKKKMDMKKCLVELGYLLSFCKNPPDVNFDKTENSLS